MWASSPGVGTVGCRPRRRQPGPAADYGVESRHPGLAATAGLIGCVRMAAAVSGADAPSYAGDWVGVVTATRSESASTRSRWWLGTSTPSTSAVAQRKQMNRLSRYRLHPTGKQQTAMSQMLRDHCRLDNAGVAGTSRPVPRVQACQQQTPRHLDKAFAVFFARIKAGQTPGYPRFAPVARFDT